MTGVAQADVVAVLETDPTGHRLHYLAHLVAVIGPGRARVLTSERAVRSEEYSLLVEPHTRAAVVLPDADSPRALLDAAVEAALRSGARTLVLPEADPFLVPLLVLLLRRPRLDLELRLLIMRTTEVGGPERLRRATVAKPVLAALLRPFRQVRLLFLTDAFDVVTRRRGFAGACGPCPIRSTFRPGPLGPRGRTGVPPRRRAPR